MTTILASMEIENDHYPYYVAPELQKEREKSSLVWQELMDVVLGWEFVTMKRDKGKRCLMLEKSMHDERCLTVIYCARVVFAVCNIVYA